MAMQDLRVALLPLDIKLEDKAYNISLAIERINDLSNEVDVVVLPELFNVGFGKYSVSASCLAEFDNGETISRMKKISAERKIAIIGGFIGKSNEGLLNRAFIISDGQLCSCYNKRHLFPGMESRLFHPGEELSPIINIKGWNLRVAICYDLRFPVWNRAVNNNYDALILIANWPNSRYYAWNQLIKARAIENQVYVAACNREGEDIYGKYERFDSMIVDPMGLNIGENHDSGTVLATFSKEQINSIRENFQPWRAADDFTINL